MISITLPSRESVIDLIESVSDSPYSYPEVGATQGALPPGYNIDRSRQVITHGESGFSAAKTAFRRWAPFRLPWIRTFAQDEPRVGCVVAVVAHLVGLWWTNVSRVVYTIDEPRCFGFAYGTLGCHAEMGEERFTVELDRQTDDVAYSVLAFSRPRHVLARLGYPLSRAAQRRFGAQTVEAMRQEVARLHA